MYIHVHVRMWWVVLWRGVDMVFDNVHMYMYSMITSCAL